MVLPDIHSSLRRLISDYGGISPLEVDIRFEAPTKEWITRLTRPTINLFLFDLHENTELRQNNFETTRANGQGIRRLPPRRINLQYMVSALTTEVDDAHRLLWRTLVTLLKYPELPLELLPDDVVHLQTPLTARVTEPEDGTKLLSIWGSLGADPRPALSYIVTVPLDIELAIQSPLTLTRRTSYINVDAPDGTPDMRIDISGVVRGRDAEPLAGVQVVVEGGSPTAGITDGDGWFALRRVPTGTVRLRASRDDGTHTTVTVEVPGTSYDIVLD